METIKMLVMSPDGNIDEVMVLADSIESVIKQFGSWEIGYAELSPLNKQLATNSKMQVQEWFGKYVN